MRKRAHSACAVFFILIFLLLSLSGCSSPRSSESASQTLWVLMERSTSDGYNLQAELIAEQMRQTHEGLIIELEILPIEEVEREVRLKQLHTQIMAGNGPDVYLLPAGDTLVFDYGGASRKVHYLQVPALFYDPSQAIRNGVFADISTYYDADDALKKDELNTAIMDVGLFDGARYVFPLHYDLPVLMTGAGLFVNARLDSLVEDALASGDTAALIGLQLPDDLSVFSQIFDYEDGTMLLSVEDIAAYMRLYQRWAAARAQPEQEWLSEQRETVYSRSVPSRADRNADYISSIVLSSFNSISDYIIGRIYWDTAGLPCFRSTLADTFQSAAIAKAHDFPLVMSPMRSADGCVTAEVTYYGAVGSSSQNPALAYEFLRQFLLEEYQWELYRPQLEGKPIVSSATSKTYIELQCRGIVERSWPVRTVGSTPHLWENIQYQNRGVYTSYILGTARETALYQDESLVLTDEDIPALDFEIDAVRFPIIQQGENTLKSALAQLNNDDGTPTDVDIDKLAQQVWTDLWWHLAEG